MRLNAEQVTAVREILSRVNKDMAYTISDSTVEQIVEEIAKITFFPPLYKINLDKETIEKIANDLVPGAVFSVETSLPGIPIFKGVHPSIDTVKHVQAPAITNKSYADKVNKIMDEIESEAESIRNSSRESGEGDAKS